MCRCVIIAQAGLAEFGSALEVEGDVDDKREWYDREVVTRQLRYIDSLYT